jgi:hypothetical protein
VRIFDDEAVKPRSRIGTSFKGGGFSDLSDPLGTPKTELMIPFESM